MSEPQRLLCRRQHRGYTVLPRDPLSAVYTPAIVDCYRRCRVLVLFRKVYQFRPEYARPFLFQLHTHCHVSAFLVFYGRTLHQHAHSYEAIEDKHGNHRNRTAVRFLIFCDDELLLHHSADELWGYSCRSDNKPNFVFRAAPGRNVLFNEITGLQAPAMRYCFTNAGFATGSNMVHYAVFVDQDQKEKFTNEDVWFNPYMLDSAMLQACSRRYLPTSFSESTPSLWLGKHTTETANDYTLFATTAPLSGCATCGIGLSTTTTNRGLM